MLDDHYLVMRLSEDQYKANFGTEEEMRQALPGTTKRWTNGVVPFVFHSSVSSSNRAKINNALTELNNALTNCLVVR